MSRFPYMSFPIDQYFEETGDLTLEEHAVLTLLLGIAWQRGGVLPIDLCDIRRLLQIKVARLDGRVFNRVVPKILARFFEKSEEGYRNEGIDAALSRALATSERQRSNALARGSGLKDFKHLGHAMATPNKSKRIISTSSAVFARVRGERAIGGNQVDKAQPTDYSHDAPTIGVALRAKLGLPQSQSPPTELPLAVAAE